MYNFLNDIPDKSEYKNTTSLKFKKELCDFFKDKNLKCCVEFGTNKGHSARVLSYLFEEIFTFDIKNENIEFSKKLNFDRTNITHFVTDVYNSDLTVYLNDVYVDCFFIDCVHEYGNVLYDIKNAKFLSNLNKDKKIYLVFDDYSHPTSTGVRKAIDKATVDFSLSFERFLGQEKGYSFNPETTLIGPEGIILSFKN